MYLDFKGLYGQLGSYIAQPALPLLYLNNLLQTHEQIQGTQKGTKFVTESTICCKKEQNHYYLYV